MHSFVVLAPLIALWCTTAAAFQAFMTFNNFPSQKSVACGSNPGDDLDKLVFAAAASDSSPDLFQGFCNYSQRDLAQDPSQCSDVAAGTYSGPGCQNSLCGQCFAVTNGNLKITVRIVDACPKYHAQNYCKNGPQFTDEDRCAAADDHLDVSDAAREYIGAGNNNLPAVEVEPLPSCPM